MEVKFMIRKVIGITRILGLCLALGLFAVAGLSYGQANSATLGGTVADATGAAIPGATVTLTDQANGFTRVVKSDAAGGYNITGISPGTFTVTVTAPGFQTTVNKGIQLTISQVGTLNVQLAVGKAEQTVTVQCGSATVNTTNATLGGGIAPETLQDFPLIISGAPRSSVTVALMLPGVSTGGTGNA